MTWDSGGGEKIRWRKKKMPYSCGSSFGICRQHCENCIQNKRSTEQPEMHLAINLSLLDDLNTFWYFGQTVYRLGKELRCKVFSVHWTLKKGAETRRGRRNRREGERAVTPTASDRKGGRAYIHWREHILFFLPHPVWVIISHNIYLAPARTDSIMSGTKGPFRPGCFKYKQWRNILKFWLTVSPSFSPSSSRGKAIQQ